MVRVHISESLRAVVGGEAVLSADGTTVREVLDDLESRHPGLRRRVLDDQGRFRRYALVFVGSEQVADADPREIEVARDAEIHIMPNVAGG